MTMGDFQPSGLLASLRGRSAAVDGGDSPVVRAVRGCLVEAGMRCLPGPEADGPWRGEVPDLYCAVGAVDGVPGAAASTTRLPQARIESLAEAMAARGKGRMVLVTTEAHRRVLHPAYALRAAEQAAEMHYWRHLAARFAARDVIINAISLGYAPFAGQALPPELERQLLRHLAIRRGARPADLKAALLFLASDDCSALVGQALPLTGGLGLHLVPPPARPGPAGSASIQGEPDAPPDPFSLRGKAVLVVGASTGIGRATARLLADRGAEVAVAARSRSALAALTEEIRARGGSAVAAVCDVLASDGGAGAVRQSWEALGRLDGLVYAAGYMPLKSDDLGEDGWDRTFGVNLDGFVQVSRAAIAEWRAHGRPGVITSISSIGADEAVIVPNLESYSASKAAMTQFTRCLATTFGRHGIRANSVQPGIVRTPMAEWVTPEFQQCWFAQMPIGRVCEPEEIANVCAFLTSPAAAYMTGEVVKVDGGFVLGALPPLRAEPRP